MPAARRPNLTGSDLETAVDAVLRLMRQRDPVHAPRDARNGRSVYASSDGQSLALTGWRFVMTRTQTTTPSMNHDQVSVGQMTLQLQRLSPQAFRTALETAIGALEADAQTRPVSSASLTPSSAPESVGLTQFALIQSIDSHAMRHLLLQMHDAAWQETGGMLLRVGALGSEWMARTVRQDFEEPCLEALLSTNGLRHADQGVFRQRGEYPCRHEMLARFLFADGSVRSAGEVLTGTEPSTVLAQLDQRMLTEAISRLMADETLRLSLNVCRTSLNDPDWLTRLQCLSATYPKALDRLVFEITEWPARAQKTPLTQALKPVCALGLSVWLDDFGAGLTSFNEAFFPGVTGLKIDRSLLRSAWINQDAFGTLNAIARFAQRQGKICVIEGVETAEERSFAERCGASHVQGFFSGRV